MSCPAFPGPPDRFCRRVQNCSHFPPQPPCRPPILPDACRKMAFWPCWNSDALFEANRPRPRCQKCGCELLERQDRFARCLSCGWIGFYDDCCTVCCSLRSCCDTVLWPCRPGEPR